MHVLLVDDERELVSTLAERLALRGIRAEWVTSSEEALERVRARCFDVAVLDVKIPRMSGLELQKQLAEHCPAMKYIFLTGHGSEEDFRTGSAKAGDDNYLIKPVKIETLIDKLQRLMTAAEGGGA
jgi:DNA-binding response OmpR family regulator